MQTQQVFCFTHIMHSLAFDVAQLAELPRIYSYNLKKKKVQ